jgi:hypothetical protein
MAKQYRKIQNIIFLITKSIKNSPKALSNQNILKGKITDLSMIDQLLILIDQLLLCFSRRSLVLIRFVSSMMA